MKNILKNASKNKRARCFFILSYILITLQLLSGCNFTTVVGSVKVKCVYMAYACGDCTPQYQVIEVIKPVSLKDKFLKQDIEIAFDDIQIENQFKKKIGNCSICYYYEFYGNMKYERKRKCYVLNIEQYNLVLKNKECCNP